MTKETRMEIIRHGLRWATNIIVEIIANHASCLDTETQKELREVSLKIQAVQTRMHL